MIIGEKKPAYKYSLKVRPYCAPLLSYLRASVRPLLLNIRQLFFRHRSGIVRYQICRIEHP